MRPVLLVLALGAVALLAGCLEVPQHPPWRQGEYRGKPDNMPEQVNYHGDRLSWSAVILNRNWLQDEYPRSGDKGASDD